MRFIPLCRVTSGGMILKSSLLSINTDSINFDHLLRCGGWLNFERVLIILSEVSLYFLFI